MSLKGTARMDFLRADRRSFALPLSFVKPCGISDTNQTTPNNAETMQNKGKLSLTPPQTSRNNAEILLTCVSFVKSPHISFFCSSQEWVIPLPRLMLPFLDLGARCQTDEELPGAVFSTALSSCAHFFLGRRVILSPVSRNIKKLTPCSGFKRTIRITLLKLGIF